MKIPLRVVVISPECTYATHLQSKIANANLSIEVVGIPNEAELFPVLFKDDCFNLICIKKETPVSKAMLQAYKVYENAKYNLRLYVFQEAHKKEVDCLNTKTSLFLKQHYPLLQSISHVAFFKPKL